MTLDPRAKRLLDMMKLPTSANSGTLTTAARREGFAKLMDIGEKPVSIAFTHDIVVQENDVSIKLRLYRAQDIDGAPQPAVIFFHGGGLVAGSIDTHDGICRRLAITSNATVISIDYRLAPEARFPASLEDAATAIDWIAANAGNLNIDSDRIAIAGESAGALLATLCCNGYQHINLRPKAQLLLCPVVDLAATFPSRLEYGDGYLIDRSTLLRDIEDCLGTGARAEHLPAPFRNGDLASSPETIIVSAGCDPFRDEASHYETLLRDKGVPVWHMHHPGMVHSFYGLPAFLPQADVALGDAGRKLATILG